MIGRPTIPIGRVAGARGTTAFRHRNSRIFFVGQTVSLVGTWMQQVAQAWLVLELTHDPVWLGIVAAAQFLPVMVFGLFAGVLADALPKRWVLIWTQASMMVLATILAVLVFTLDRPDPRARAIYRLELREAIGEALRDGHPTRAAAMAEEAIAEAGRRNVPGWTVEDVAWFGARRDEARTLERSR